MHSALTSSIHGEQENLAETARLRTVMNPRQHGAIPAGCPSGSDPLRWFAGRCVHLIGIGGCGMSGAAAVLQAAGAIVSGSDQTAFVGMGSLVERGVCVVIDHDETNLGMDVELVVISAAIPPTNVELAAARGRGLRVIKYAELLGMMMERFRGVAIAGTHGKSTTTALCAHLFREAGLSPSFVVGARSDQLGGSSALGSGPHLIVESCEFDRSFLHVRPETAAVLNIETDHVDCFRDFDEIVDAFAEFIGNVDADGLVVCNGDDRWAMEAASRAKRTVETFGIGDGVDWRACRLESDRGRFAFDVEYRGSHLLSARLSIPGLHNVMNALAALALAYHADGDPERIGAAVHTFAGINRRMTLRGACGGVTIVDDYAHHPTEIRVTIEAMRNRYRPKRIWVVFQPHQQARTDHFLEDFAVSFADADEVVVPDVYAVRESSEGRARTGSECLAERIREHGGRARYLPTLEAATEHVVRHATSGDLVLTMGAGDVWKVADELVQRIC